MRRGRTRFFRRAGGMAFVLLMLSVWGALAFVRLVATAFHVPTPFGPAALGIVAIGIPVLLIAAMMGAIARPLGRVMEAADRVAEGDYTVRVEERGTAPMRALARSFNTMTGRLAGHDRLRRDLMADIAHELRTPLTVVQGTLEGLIDGVYTRDARYLQQMLEEVHVLSRLIEDLRTLALSDSGALKLQKEPTDLAALVRGVADGFNADGATRGVALRIDAPNDSVSVNVDPVRMREVSSNLLSNALRRTPAGGSVTVRLSAVPPGATNVEVTDTGPGMTPEAIARVFDRFYKGSDSRGSGLGLTIARSLVTAHGGSIRASSPPVGGTTINLTLPKDDSGTWETRP
jgi:two-component system, OmpR family, sensor histidine kinase BaeS